MGKVNLGSGSSSKESTPRKLNTATILLWLSLVFFLCQLFNLRITQAKASSPDRFPLSIRATSQADYRADPHATIPSIRNEILNQIIFDIPGTGNPINRISTLEAALLSPVPTMTGNYHLPTRAATFTRVHSTATVISHLTFAIPTSYIPPTATVRYSYPTLSYASPTATRTPRPTKIITKTPTATQTATATRTLTSTATATATASGSPSPTGTATASATSPFTPTATDTNTATSTATDTATASATDTATSTAIPSPTVTLSTGCVADPSGGFRAVQDTWVDKTNPTMSNGSDSILTIRPTGGVDQRALVAFDLSSIPAGSTVLSAALYITVSNGGNYAVEFYPVTEVWDESSTWNTQPTYDPTSAGSLTLTTNICTRVASLSAALVQSWVDDPASNYGVYLYPPGGSGQATFSSREGTSAPKLIVNYVP